MVGGEEDELGRRKSGVHGVKECETIATAKVERRVEPNIRAAAGNVQRFARAWRKGGGELTIMTQRSTWVAAQRLLAWMILWNPLAHQGAIQPGGDEEWFKLQRREVRVRGHAGRTARSKDCGTDEEAENPGFAEVAEVEECKIRRGRPVHDTICAADVSISKKLRTWQHVPYSGGDYVRLLLGAVTWEYMEEHDGERTCAGLHGERSASAGEADREERDARLPASDKKALQSTKLSQKSALV
ncbi:hypothetical protein H4582DRAFT_2062843 [Lactarius indigo]|nr:hypothetical protein H4582DRAFT_2062843 [Lactarius indigo]